MAGLLEIVVILWKSIHRSMERNKEARLYTIDKFASVLPEYLRVFQVSSPFVSKQMAGTVERDSQRCPPCLLHPGAWSVAGGAQPALTGSGAGC